MRSAEDISNTTYKASVILPEDGFLKDFGIVPKFHFASLIVRSAAHPHRGTYVLEKPLNLALCDLVFYLWMSYMLATKCSVMSERCGRRRCARNKGSWSYRDQKHTASTSTGTLSSRTSPYCFILLETSWKVRAHVAMFPTAGPTTHAAHVLARDMMVSCGLIQG